MPTLPMRSITVDGTRYRWRFVPRYDHAATSADGCHDVFVAYGLASRRSPLRIHFRTWEDPMIGGPLRVGAAFDLENWGQPGLNLHTPGAAAALIRAGVRRGWNPEAQRAPFVIDDGLPLLREILAAGVNQTSGPGNPA